ncbi:MAG: T9SS type A sorting domain-containing protein [Candidatus Eisenbacteria bacterium]|nr:T9SS type A sorting domain-containing protein [Candidatus Eisenbacteria bacterium]
MIARAQLRRWLAAVASLAMLVAAPSRAQQSYHLTDLGSLGGVRGSGAYAHRGGVSVGYSFVAGSSFVHAMLNDRGTVVDLGTLGGTQSLARAVNSHGQVVGWAYLPGLAWQRAFLWQGGVMTDLGTFGGNVSDALDLNDAGIVVGSSFDLLGRERAFWWEGGALHDLGTIGGSQSRASGINQWGDITGMAQIEGDDEFHAFLSKPGSPLYDLGTLGGPASHAHDINDLVQVCGWSMIEPNNPASRGFVWADGIMKSVGTLGGIYSAAFGLNNLGQVVGASTRADGTQAAFLWQGDQIVDLNTLLPPGSGWFLSSASDIDANGAIVGEGLNPQGKSRAYLLTPAATTDVPHAQARLAFAGAWPNPVRAGTRFRFELPAAGQASLELFDLSGRRVRALATGAFGAGPQSVAWDGRDESGEWAGAGAYFAQLRTPAGTLTRRFVVVR